MLLIKYRLHKENINLYVAKPNIIYIYNLIHLTNINLGLNITVVSSGFLAPAPGQAAFGLYAALSSGGNLVPLPLTPTVGINDLTIDGNVKLYPNPTSSVLNLNSANETILFVSIQDVNGKELYNNSKVNANTLAIDLSTFESGLYTIKVETKTSLNVEILIITK